MLIAKHRPPMNGFMYRWCLQTAVMAGLLLGWMLAVAEPWQDAALIGEAAEDAARTHLSSAAGSVVVKAERLDPHLRLPACNQPLVADLPAAARLSARLTVAVRCTSNTPWRVYVPVRVTVTRMLVVTAAPLPRGKVLAPGDMILAEREISVAPGGYFTTLDAATGRVLRRPVAAGVVLSPGLLDAPLLVRRGQAVTLEARSGGIAVQMAGVSRADGSQGDRIEVKNISSGKVVQGIVKNEKTIEIPLP